MNHFLQDPLLNEQEEEDEVEGKRQRVVGDLNKHSYLEVDANGHVVLNALGVFRSGRLHVPAKTP